MILQNKYNYFGNYFLETVSKIIISEYYFNINFYNAIFA